MDSEARDVPLFADLNDADPAVVEAVSEARRTFPQFLNAASKMRFSPAIYLVKMPFGRSGFAAGWEERSARPQLLGGCQPSEHSGRIPLDYRPLWLAFLGSYA